MLRLGIIYPGGCSEYEYYQMAESISDDEARIYLVTTRLWGEDNDHDIQALMKTGDVKQIKQAALKLSFLNPDSAIWACTSGSFVGGVSMAHGQNLAIAEGAGCPASNTSQAFSNAAKKLGVHKLAVTATYPQDITDRFLQFLKQKGFVVCNHVSLNRISGWDAARVSKNELFDAVCRTDTQDSDAVLIPDTAIATLEIVEPLERKLRKPVLSANQVTFWELLRLADSQIRMRGFGRLLCQ